MTKIHLTTILLLLLTVCLSCSSDDNETASETEKVYIIGYTDDPSNGETVTLFENGIQSDLSALDLSGRNRGSFAFAQNNDLYVAVDELENRVAKIFKNGTLIFESEPALSAIINSIFVSGNDVYACGSTVSNGTAVATFWKNGVPTFLETRLSIAASIFVDGTDVYICGFVRDEAAILSRAAYWKNNVLTVLNNENYRTRAKEIFVKDGEVHIIGEGYDTYDLAKYWKNNDETNLNSGILSATAEGIYVDDTTVYVAGRDAEDSPVLWKNGVPEFINESTKEEGIAIDVTVVVNDLYVMAYVEEQNSEPQIKVFKNGSELLSIPGNANLNIEAMAVMN